MADVEFFRTSFRCRAVFAHPASEGFCGFCSPHCNDKRRAMSAQLSWQTACELGFRGNLDEWERLMGAVARR